MPVESQCWEEQSNETGGNEKMTAQPAAGSQHAAAF